MKNSNPKKFIVKATALFMLVVSNYNAQDVHPWTGNETDPCINPATTWYLGGNNLLAPIPTAQQVGGLPPSYTIHNDAGTCNEYDFILKSNNKQLIFLTTAKRVGIGHNNSTPTALLDVFDNSNANIFHTLIKGDKYGTIETGGEMNLNYANSNNFNINEGPLNRFKISNGVTQNFGNFIIGGHSYNPIVTAMAMIDAKNHNGLRIESDNSNDALQVFNSSGSARMRLWVNSGGGEDTKFHIAGAGQIGFTQSNSIVDNTCRLNIDANGNIFNGVKVSVNNASAKAFYIDNSNTAPFEVLGDGRTRIGTWRANVNGPCANAMLTVAGQILAKEIRVAISQGSGVNDRWADYVFEEDYQLMPLKKVEAFVQKNHHLPDVPSEAEVLKDGVDITKMNIALLKKVEELTLYVIELKKESDLQKVELNNLKRK